MTSGAATHFDALRAAVETALQAALPAPPDCPPDLAEAMRYSLLAGGKRLRPLLCLTACESVGGHALQAMPAACALEFIHTYSLIHDDLPAMDDDTMRRGRPTLHVVAGEGLAILAGDGLLTEAFGLLSRVPPSATTAARSVRVIGLIAAAAGVSGMVGGQAIDLGSAGSGTAEAGRHSFDMAAVQSMHARKTGALIRASAVAGAIMGGGDDEAVASIDRAAAEFGLAFQIVDDILDVEGSSSELGKTAGKDAAAGKPTYPAVFGLERSRQEAAQCLVRAREALAHAGLASTHLLALGQAMVERSR
ncbi:MAG: polyprenyl synthetase family protein [Vicinamibacterales bacterium]